MPTFALIFIWIMTGLLVGALALAARFKPANWSWFWLLISGSGAALLGGLLGFWLLGRLFSTAVALWLAVLLTCLPGIYANACRRLVRH